MGFSDEDLMMAYVQGDERAFQELYARYESRLSNFLSRRLTAKDRHLLPDLFQLTWLKLHQARSKFEKGQKFSPWFFTIAINSLRDQVQEKWNRDKAQLSDHLSSDEVSSEEKIILDEIIEKLKEGLAELSPLQRDIILLSDHEGFQSREIANMLNLTDGAVRQNLFRARQSIRQMMKGFYGA